MRDCLRRARPKQRIELRARAIGERLRRSRHREAPQTWSSRTRKEARPRLPVVRAARPSSARERDAFRKTGRSRSFCKRQLANFLRRDNPPPAVSRESRHCLVSPRRRNSKFRFQEEQGQLRQRFHRLDDLPSPATARCVPRRERTAHPIRSPAARVVRRASGKRRRRAARSIRATCSPRRCFRRPVLRHGEFFFRSVIRTRGSSLISAKKLRAARTTRLSSPAGRLGSSEEKQCTAADSLGSIVSSSPSEIGAINVSIS